MGGVVTNRSWPVLGCGVGLRSPHYPVITETWPSMDWFEAVSENYMDTGGRPIHILEKVRQHYPIALHGTALSIGSVDPLNPDYLARLKKLIERIDPFIVSDHLCWSGAEGEVLHDLLPLPFTEESIRHVVSRVERVQEGLGRRILLENVSTYVTYRHSTMPEWEFLVEVTKRSGCGILLDLNNIYVNATNHQFDPYEYLRNIPAELVGQFHLAGHTDMGTFLFDTHSATVIEPVWDLYRDALRRFGLVSTLIEWDENIPPFDELAAEAERARAIYCEHDHFVTMGIPNVEARFTAPRERVKGGMNPAPTAEVSLPQIERWFKSKIQPVTPSPQPSPLKGRGKGEGWQDVILNPQGGVAGAERLAVYANGYLARIAESLKEAYEAVHHIIGTEKFLELCEGYARRYPSRSYNLNYAGRYFPEFLRTALTGAPLPFLPDLAQLEWLLWEAFHSFEGTPLDPSQIGDISMEDWEHCQIVFQPSVRVFGSDWQVLDLWLNRHKPCPEIQPEERRKSERVLIGRKEDQVRCEYLDENQYRLLEGLLAGKNLGAVCEELAGTVDEENLPIAEWFSRWVQDGLILRLEFKPKPLDCVSGRSETL